MKSLQDDQPTGFSKLCGLFSIGLTIDFISISQYPEVKSSTFLLNQSWIPICCFFPIPRTNPTRSGWWFTYPFENDGVRQLGWWHSQLNGKIKFIFQTTNQKSSWNLHGNPWTPPEKSWRLQRDHHFWAMERGVSSRPPGASRRSVGDRGDSMVGDRFFGLKWINMDQSGLTKIMVGNWLFSGFQ